jgi:Tfp pilus assembly protein PilO
MNMDIFESLGVSTDLIVIVLAFIVILQFVWIFVILAKCNKLNKRISKFTTGNYD